MKISIYQDVLLKPLEQVSKALPGKPTIPILSNILFQVDDNGLHLVASDTDITIKAHVLASEFEIIKTGSITLPGRKIVEIVKKLHGEMTIETNGVEVKITAGKSKFDMTGIDAEEFPAFHESQGESIKMNGLIFKNLVNKSIFATSKNQATSILTGINFEISPEMVTLTATDRHRLARIENDIETGLESSLVISAECLVELLKIIPDKEDIELSFLPDKFIAKTSEFTFTSRVLEGAYPDVSKGIPTTFNAHVTVKTKELLESLDRVLIVATEEKTNLIKMTVGEDITIQSKAQTNSVMDGVEHTEKHGDDFHVHLNGRFLLEALKTIDAEETKINFVGPMSPMIIHGVEAENERHLVLPYRQNN